MVNRCFGCVAFRDDIPTGLFYSGYLHGKEFAFRKMDYYVVYLNGVALLS